MLHSTAVHSKTLAQHSAGAQFLNIRLTSSHTASFVGTQEIDRLADKIKVIQKSPQGHWHGSQ